MEWPEVGAIPIGGNPTGVALDPTSGELYVTSLSAGTITIVNATDDAVVSTIDDASGMPSSDVYDPANRELLVVEGTQDRVTPIDVGNGSQEPQISVGNDPYDILYDPANGLLYVTNDGSGNVSVINGSTDRSAGAGIPVGSSPIGLAVDPASDTIFVANEGSGTISVIDGSNDTVVANVTLGGQPYALAWDPADGDLYATNVAGALGEVEVVNGTSLEVVAVDTVGAMPVGAAYDAFTGEVLVANRNSGNLSIVSGITDSVVATFALGASPGPIVVDPETDSAFVANFGSGNVSVLARPLASTLSSGPVVADVGEAVRLLAQPIYGVGPFRHFAWSLGDGGRSTTASSNLTHSYSAPGTYSVEVTVTDAANITSEASLALVVHARPIEATPRASRAAADVGESVVFTASATLGTVPYATYTWSGLGADCDAATTSSVSCLMTTSGVAQVSVAVTDAAGVTVPAATPLRLAIDPDPTADSPSSFRASGDVGQAVTFAVQGGGGTGNLSFVWSGLPGGCSPGPGGIVCGLTTPGLYDVQAQAVDENGMYSLLGPALAFTVFRDPTVSVVADRVNIDVGESLNLSALPELGSGGYNVTWWDAPPGCLVNQLELNCVGPFPSTFTPWAVLTDSDGGSVASTPVRVVISPSVSLSTVTFSGSLVAGSPLTFTAHLSGGTAPLTETWIFPGGSTSQGPVSTHAFPSPGTYRVVVWVNDSAGESVEARLSVSLPPPAAAPSPWNTDAATLIVGAMALVLVPVAYALRQRRRGRSRRGPA